MTSGLVTGTHRKLPGQTQGNLFLTFLAAWGLPETKFGDDGSGTPRYTSLESPLTELKVGVTFTYTFDFGDNWLHHCEVLPTMDPPEVLGGLVLQVVPIDGWGDLPDQHGRKSDPDERP